MTVPFLFLAMIAATIYIAATWRKQASAPQTPTDLDTIAKAMGFDSWAAIPTTHNYKQQHTPILRDNNHRIYEIGERRGNGQMAI